jgi:hypothetical protein
MHFSHSEIFVTIFSLHKFRCKITTFLEHMQIYLSKIAQKVHFFCIYYAKFDNPD